MIRQIPLNLIESNNLRVESRLESEDLQNSFQRVGQLSPICVRPHPCKQNLFQVIYGNRRLQAARSLGWKSILADVVSASDEKTWTMAFSENESRLDFTDYEKALVIEEMHKATGKTYFEIAKLLGKSVAYISQHISMLDLFPDGIARPDELNRVLCSLTERQARSLAKIQDPLERWNTAKLAVTAGLCAREISRLISNSGQKKSKKNSSTKMILQELIQKIVDGINSNDLAPLFQIRSSTGFTLFDDFPPFSRMDNVSAKEHQLGFLHKVGGLRMEIRDLQINALRNFACATMFASYKLGNHNYPFQYTSRVTIVFMKQRDTWKIIHEHWSMSDERVFQMDPSSINSENRISRREFEPVVNV